MHLFVRFERPKNPSVPAVSLLSRSPVSFFWVFLYVLLVPGTAFSKPDVTYHRLISPKVQREFYRSGGHSHLGKKVYLYVRVSALARTPEIVRPRAGRITHRYRNKTVPLLIRPTHKDLRRVLSRSEKSRWVSLRGTVVLDPTRPGKTVISVQRIRRLPKTFKPDQ